MRARLTRASITAISAALMFSSFLGRPIGICTLSLV
jgi:hypothetical protein